MSSLAATLLARSSATVQTRQALIVTGLQNDFLSPDGKLPMTTSSNFVERIREVVPAFREHGIIIWVWTEYRGDRTVNDPSGNGCRVMIAEAQPPATRPLDPSREQEPPPGASVPRLPRSMGRHNAIIARALGTTMDPDSGEDSEPEASLTSEDPELFLSETSAKQACCKPGTWGAEPIDEIKDLIQPNDIQITKSYYSAFTGTSLLLQLRAKLITDLYFAGCNTNLSVYATATDVARYGLKINIVRDCLGCRNTNRHKRAVAEMVSYMGAEVTTSFSVLARLRGEEVSDDDDSENTAAHEDDDDDESNDRDADVDDNGSETPTSPALAQRSSTQAPETLPLSMQNLLALSVHQVHATISPPPLMKRTSAKRQRPQGSSDSSGSVRVRS
ncbi:hypothetical protein AAFC00_000874 [Neodothiora populina]|uniref:Isochorismatase-like domain-containing protein n=1 Tax=Neodothiora populina TaxID=2781224 RepID=A0ABR3PN28_9PEZI